MASDPNARDFRGQAECGSPYNRRKQGRLGQRPAAVAPMKLRQRKAHMQALPDEVNLKLSSSSTRLSSPSFKTRAKNVSLSLDSALSLCQDSSEEEDTHLTEGELVRSSSFSATAMFGQKVMSPGAKRKLFDRGAERCLVDIMGAVPSGMDLDSRHSAASPELATVPTSEDVVGHCTEKSSWTSEGHDEADFPEEQLLTPKCPQLLPVCPGAPKKAKTKKGWRLPPERLARIARPLFQD